MKKVRNLFRIDTGNTHGWQVRIERYGESYTKFFSDSKFEKGSQGAYDTALDWRDNKLAELPDPESPIARLHNKKVREKQWRAINRTGVKGIGFSMTRKKNSSSRTPYVQAYWRDANGKPKATSFSVEKHGGKKALKLAVDALIAGGGSDLKDRTLVNKAWPQIKTLLEEAGYHALKGVRIPSSQDD